MPGSSGTEVIALYCRAPRQQRAGKDQKTHEPEQAHEMFVLNT